MSKPTSPVEQVVLERCPRAGRVRHRRGSPPRRRARCRPPTSRPASAADAGSTGPWPPGPPRCRSRAWSWARTASTRARRCAAGPPCLGLRRGSRVALHHEPHEVVVAALATRNRLLIRARPSGLRRAGRHRHRRSGRRRRGRRGGGRFPSHPGGCPCPCPPHRTSSPPSPSTRSSPSRATMTSASAVPVEQVVAGRADESRGYAAAVRGRGPGGRRSEPGPSSRRRAVRWRRTTTTVLMVCPTLEPLAGFAPEVA